jgi:hypothetical protein
MWEETPQISLKVLRLKHMHTVGKIGLKGIPD